MAFNNQQAISALATRLNSFADELGEMIRRNSEQNGLPRAIGDSIVKHPVESSGGNLSVEVVVGGEEAPMAIAYEFGSGLHRKRGTPGKYEIEPDTAPLLAFDWKPLYVPWQSIKLHSVILDDKQGTQGRYFFNWVEHPGVEARPFVVPAINEILPKMKQELSKEVKAILSIGTQRVTVIRA